MSKNRHVSVAVSCMEQQLHGVTCRMGEICHICPVLYLLVSACYTSDFAYGHDWKKQRKVTEMLQLLHLIKVVIKVLVRDDWINMYNLNPTAHGFI